MAVGIPRFKTPSKDFGKRGKIMGLGNSLKNKATSYLTHALDLGRATGQSVSDAYRKGQMGRMGRDIAGATHAGMKSHGGAGYIGLGGAAAGGAYGAYSNDTSVAGGMAMGGIAGYAGMRGGRAAYSYAKGRMKK